MEDLKKTQEESGISKELDELKNTQEQLFSYANEIEELFKNKKV